MAALEEHIRLCRSSFGMHKIAQLCLIEPFDLEAVKTEIENIRPTLSNLALIKETLAFESNVVTSNFGSQTFQLAGETMFHIIFQTSRYEVLELILKLLTDAGHDRQVVLKEILEVRNILGLNVLSSGWLNAPDTLQTEIILTGVNPTPKVRPKAETKYQYLPPLGEKGLQYPEIYLAAYKQDLHHLAILLKRGTSLTDLPFSTRKQREAYQDSHGHKLYKEVEVRLESQTPIIGFWADRLHDEIPDPQILQILMEHGADINAKFNIEGSIVKVGLRSLGWRNQKFVDCLIRHGALLDLEDCRLVEDYFSNRYLSQEAYEIAMKRKAELERSQPAKRPTQTPTPSIPSVSKEHTLKTIQKQFVGMMESYLRLPIIFHRQRATALKAAFTRSQTPEQLLALIVRELEKYQKPTRTRSSFLGLEDPEGLRNNRKGPSWGYYGWLTKAKNLCESHNVKLSDKEQPTPTQKL